MRDRLRHALSSARIASGIPLLVAFIFYDRAGPGTGIGHWMPVSIMRAAPGTGPVVGTVADRAATGMCALGLFLTPCVPTRQGLTTSTAIRFVTFMTVGVVTGYFAKRTRLLMG